MKGIKVIALTFITIAIISVGALMILDMKNKKKEKSKSKALDVDALDIDGLEDQNESNEYIAKGSEKLKELRKIGKDLFKNNAQLRGFDIDEQRKEAKDNKGILHINTRRNHKPAYIEIGEVKNYKKHRFKIREPSAI